MSFLVPGLIAAYISIVTFYRYEDKEKAPLIIVGFIAIALYYVYRDIKIECKRNRKGRIIDKKLKLHYVILVVIISICSIGYIQKGGRYSKDPLATGWAVMLLSIILIVIGVRSVYSGYRSIMKILRK